MKIEFSTRDYELSHGAKPRGRGNWAFVDRRHARRDDYLDFVFWAPHGTLAEAKRAATKYFNAHVSCSGVVEICS